jgi:hypothetical protein
VAKGLCCEEKGRKGSSGDVVGMIERRRRRRPDLRLPKLLEWSGSPFDLLESEEKDNLGGKRDTGYQVWSESNGLFNRIGEVGKTEAMLKKNNTTKTKET